MTKRKDDDMAEERPASFNARLMDAMKAMPNPVKDTKAFNYRYATLDQVLGIIQPPLMERGLFVRQCSTRPEDSTFILCTYVIDTLEDSAHCMDVRPLQYGDDQQKNGSYETYARRYALMTVFGLCGEDDDGEATALKSNRKSNQTKQAAQTAADPLTESKYRMWNALVDHFGSKDKANDELNKLMKEPEWKQTVEYFDEIAAKYQK